MRWDSPESKTRSWALIITHFKYFIWDCPQPLYARPFPRGNLTQFLKWYVK